MQVSQLWRYPVKSMVGGTVDEVELDELGIVGDRTWATRTSARRHPGSQEDRRTDALRRP